MYITIIYTLGGYDMSKIRWTKTKLVLNGS